jgi:hypothetical protein
MDLRQFAAAIGTGMTDAPIAIDPALVLRRSETDKAAAEILGRLADEHPTWTHDQVEQTLVAALFWLQLWNALATARAAQEGAPR